MLKFISHIYVNKRFFYYTWKNVLLLRRKSKFQFIVVHKQMKNEMERRERTRASVYVCVSCLDSMCMHATEISLFRVILERGPPNERNQFEG